MAQTTWQVGDPEPEPGPLSQRILLRGRTAAWYPYEGGWRTGTMAPYATIPWGTLLERDGPLREIRLVGREWVFADEIPAPRLSETDAKAARAAGWVPLADVLDAVWDIDAIQRWATRSIPLGAFIGSREIHAYLADRFGTKEER